MLHYIIIIIVIITIVLSQFYFFGKNRSKLKELENIFPKDTDDDLSTFTDDDLTTIESDYSSPIFLKVVHTINDYLTKNKGAASDFILIKDVVDRNSDSVEEEIATLTPIPLYLGLIGTMFGILIGVGFLVFTGGIEALLSTASEDANSGIMELLGGVALAMISSIMGIFLTTSASYLTKDAKSTLNSNKNAFFSWIQVELLPSLSNNAATAVYTLQQNLAIFNTTFSSNIEGMNKAFSTVNESHKDQLELMKLVERMDVTMMAKANIQVLKELQKSTAELDKFNIYMSNVSSYLENVQQLNAGINEHLNRTHVIEEMGVFFKSEIQQIESRKAAISRIVGSVDQTLNQSLVQIQENTEQHLTKFIHHSATQQDKFIDAVNDFDCKATSTMQDQQERFNKISGDQQEKIEDSIVEQRGRLNLAIDEQQERIGVSMLEQRDKFNKVIDEQSQSLKNQLQETSVLIEEIRNLGSLKSIMQSIETSTSANSENTENLTLAIRDLCQSQSDQGYVIHNDNQPASDSTAKWMKITVITASIIIGIAGLLYIAMEIASMIMSSISDVK